VYQKSCNDDLISQIFTLAWRLSSHSGVRGIQGN